MLLVRRDDRLDGQRALPRPLSTLEHHTILPPAQLPAWVGGEERGREERERGEEGRRGGGEGGGGGGREERGRGREGERGGGGRWYYGMPCKYTMYMYCTSTQYIG